MHRLENNGISMAQTLHPVRQKNRLIEVMALASQPH